MRESEHYSKSAIAKKRMTSLHKYIHSLKMQQSEQKGVNLALKWKQHNFRFR